MSETAWPKSASILPSMSGPKRPSLAMKRSVRRVSSVGGFVSARISRLTYASSVFASENGRRPTIAPGPPSLVAP